jgi:monofunctional biosynthetic peptidoglycan transglycosylase
LTVVTALVVGAALAGLLLFRFVPIPVTPLMVWRLAEGHGLHKQWVRLDALPAHVPRAVVASEDARFCSHGGIDFEQLGDAVSTWREGGRLRGASTLSMQTTKNVFLWHGRSYVRKALEFPLTPILELAWGKARILEIYINVAELGPGVYGFEAGAQHHFGKSAAQLTAREASLLVAILPSPLTRSAAKPGKYTALRARDIERAIRLVDVGCVL